MRNALSVARRIITQVAMDRRTLALALLAPLGVITLLWFVINGGLTRPTIALLGSPPSQLRQALEDKAAIVDVATAQDGEDLVKAEKADALLDFSSTPPALTLDGADPSVTAVVAQVVQRSSMQFLSEVPLLRGIMGNTQPSITLLHGRTDSTPFEFIAPVMMGFVIFFFIFILSAISFLRERTSGTLERILATPATPMELVCGYILGFGFFAALETVLIQVFTIWVLGIPATGSFLAILAMNLALCLVALSMGTFVSAFAATEFQVLQFIPIVIIPQVLFSGILDLRQAPGWVRFLSRLFPLTYGGHALRELMLRGKPLGSLWVDLVVVLGFAGLFVGLNAASVRRVKA
ncbi:MAG TPA: ABC transporter permease [Spirochaetia bacterium]|nr:ABC transporter permease [Spirochaetia bacterium]